MLKTITINGKEEICSFNEFDEPNYYEVDQFGEPILDEQGNKIPLPMRKLVLLSQEISKDDDLQIKRKIKEELIKDDKLIFLIDNQELVKKEAANDEYFGVNIMPFLFLPDTQTACKNYICYTSNVRKMKYGGSDAVSYCDIVFTILCDAKFCIDSTTGEPKHDLLSSIIKNHFTHWGGMGTDTTLMETKESITDNNYVSKTLVFEFKTSSINNTKTNIQTGEQITKSFNDLTQKQVTDQWKI